MFKILNIFNCAYRSDLRISTAEKHKGIIRIIQNKLKIVH